MLHGYPLSLKFLRPYLLRGRVRKTSVALRNAYYHGGIFKNKEIWTVPNVITMSRIVASPGLTYAIVCDMKEVALAGCIVFGLTDWLDGYIARTFNQKTVLGAFLDPMADKVLIGALTVGLTIKGLIPIPLAAVIIGRDIALIGCSFYIRNKERPKGAPFFDTTDSATFQIVPSKLSKINTGLQFSLLTVSLMHFSTGIPSLAFIEPFWWLTAVSTLWSGVSYLDGTGLKRLSEPRKYRNDDDDKSSK